MSMRDPYTRPASADDTTASADIIPDEPARVASPYARPAGTDRSVDRSVPEYSPSEEPVIRIDHRPAPDGTDPADAAKYRRPGASVAIERRGNRRSRAERGELVIVSSGRGGGGKSTTALGLADKAAKAELSCIVIDANRGQPDVRIYMAIPRSAPVPTIYDAHATQDVTAAFMFPGDYATYRSAQGLNTPDFGLVLGPRSAQQADQKYSSPRVYGDVIDHARTLADVVIVDTQMMEQEPSDLWRHLFIPLLRADAWLVAVTDDSPPGRSNLEERLRALREDGVESGRTMVLASHYAAYTDRDEAQLNQIYSGLGSVIGHTDYDEKYRQMTHDGHLDSSNPAVSPALNAILSRVTGRIDLFTEPDHSRNGLLGRIRRGKGRA